MVYSSYLNEAILKMDDNSSCKYQVHIILKSII